MTPPISSIMFGDASSKSSLGLIKDYPLKIGDCKVPTDLTVLGIYGDKEVPLILGTPFLTTVGASIDFHKKLVTLHNINSKVAYPMKVSSTSYCGTITIANSSFKKDKVECDKVVHVLDECGEDIMDGECLIDMFSEHMGRAQKEEVCRGREATLKRKKKMEKPHPHSLDPSPGDPVKPHGSLAHAMDTTVKGVQPFTIH
ncbi:unnamed protein product [Microthlaspi erraticum]|uniref:Aspartic peptidase DDI1-type domain-containing protein n=1 Tax=Microthlaspi erraticum TaxID=1685480 RepID=A0A6D2JXB5_9BRAS|nr:unnamed protein product [Microthlaspi erraticum]